MQFESVSSRFLCPVVFCCWWSCCAAMSRSPAAKRLRVDQADAAPATCSCDDGLKLRDLTQDLAHAFESACASQCQHAVCAALELYRCRGEAILFISGATHYTWSFVVGAAKRYLLCSRPTQASLREI
jgi:hypothetical protein